MKIGQKESRVEKIKHRKTQQKNSETKLEMEMEADKNKNIEL